MKCICMYVCMYENDQIKSVMPSLYYATTFLEVEIISLLQRTNQIKHN
jgi:hypothetical protein